MRLILKRLTTGFILSSMMVILGLPLVAFAQQQDGLSVLNRDIQGGEVLEIPTKKGKPAQVMSMYHSSEDQLILSTPEETLAYNEADNIKQSKYIPGHGIFSLRVSDSTITRQVLAIQPMSPLPMAWV
ncbi:MAG: hypothetical protein ACI9FJ_002111 [Alteromonadaceae bacterium]|jgi:hypothetical protein